MPPGERPIRLDRCRRYRRKLWGLVEAGEPQAERKPEAQPKRHDDWRSYTFTAAAFRTMEFPEISYVVPGIIPEGLTILAGKPKIGKSWMALDIAIGTATSKPVLGGFRVEQGDVLYCCLGDKPRRLKRRVTNCFRRLVTNGRNG